MDNGTENTVTGAARRPYWHVDAKWISGLLSLAALTVTLLSLTLFRLTAEDRAVPLAAAAMDAYLSPAGSEGELELEDLRQRVQESEGGVFYPFQGFDVGVTLDDLENRSPSELRAHIFTGLAEEVYWSGTEAGSGEEGADIWQDIGFMAILTHRTHLSLRTVAATSGAASAVFLALMALFSFRAGRLASPGCALLLAALPGMLLFGAALGALGGPEGAPASAEGPDRLGAVLQAMKPAADIALSTYIWSAALGGLLLISAIGVGLWSRPSTNGGTANEI